MERKTLNIKLKDRISSTIIRQRTRMTDVAEFVTTEKIKWAGHIARMKDSRWTIRSTEWQIKGVRTVRRSNSLDRRHCGATENGMDKDRKGHR